jgi:hypothetical protein
VQLQRLSDGKRCVTSIAELTGLEGDIIQMQEIYRFVRESTGEDGTVPTAARWRIAARSITLTCMARSWGIGSDRSFGCAHSGARYAVGSPSSGASRAAVAYYEVCFSQMAERNSAAQSSYGLIERPGPNDWRASLRPPDRVPG